MTNPFDPKSGSPVSKADALAWIDKYDREMRKDKDTDTKSIFFGKDILAKLLVEKSAGITFFLGLKYNEDFKKDVVNLILVPTTSDGTLLWDSSSAKALGDGDAGAYDVGTPCPPYCVK